MAVLPSLSGQQVVRIFKLFGWNMVRRRSSHIIMTKEGEMATLSVPIIAAQAGYRSDRMTALEARVGGIDKRLVIVEARLKASYCRKKRKKGTDPCLQLQGQA